MKSKNNNQKTNSIILSYLIFFLLFSNSVKGQAQVNWGIDVFPIALGSHITLNADNKLLIGIEGELGFNFSNYVLFAGSNFSKATTVGDLTNKGGPNPNYYIPFLGFGIYTRILNRTKFPIDVGLRREILLNGEDGGTLDGIYTKLFWPTNFRSKGDKVRRRISGGLRLTFGTFREGDEKELGLATSAWVRIYLNYTKEKESK